MIEALEPHHEPQRKPQIGCVRDAKQKVWRRFGVQTAETKSRVTSSSGLRARSE